jgi:hypothetical protein
MPLNTVLAGIFSLTLMKHTNKGVLGALGNSTLLDNHPILSPTEIG